MNKGRTKQSLVNITVSIFNRFIVVILPFALRTIMIYTIGIEYLGVDSLFSSILNMLSLSELGFSSAVVFSMYKPIAEGDDEKVKALLTFYKHVYRIVGFIILGIGLVLLPFLESLIPEGQSYPEDINIRIVYLVLLFNTSVSYLLFAYKNSVLVASMRNDIDSVIDLIRSVASHGLQIVVLLLFRQYYLYILVLPVITITNNIIRNHIIKKRFPQYIGEGRLSKEDKKDIFTRVGALIGNKLGGTVFTSVDTIVISKYLGLVTLAQYTNYYTIFTAIFAVESAIYASFQSVVGNALVVKSKEENFSLFKDLYVINSVFTCICTACFVTLYQPFITLWVKEKNLLPFTIPVLLAVYFFVKSTRRICYLFKEATGMWREDFLKPYVSVILNLTVNIILVKIIGLPGVIISSIAALLFVEIPWESHIFFKKYFNKGTGLYFFEMIMTAVVSGAAVTASHFACTPLPQGVLGIILRAGVTVIICVAVYGIVFAFSPNTANAKKRIIRIIKKDRR